MIPRGLLPLFLVGVACGESLPADTTSGGDGGTTDAGPKDPCDDHVIYVAGDTGRDGNDGCAPDRAVRTIAGALGLVTSKKLLDREIHVCAGKYAEASLSLVVPVPLRGGYNCQTWARSGAFGKKGGFLDPDVTQIENAGTPGNPTLLISGASVTRAAIVDGFTVLGVASGNSSSVALAIGDSATPVLSDLVVVGGGTTGTGDGFGSAGIDVASGAAPEIKDSDLRGGTGIAPTGFVQGSVAVRMHGAGPAYVHDSKITSGTGTGYIGSVGVLVDESNGVRIERNDVSFGGSTSTVTDGSAAQGINVGNSSDVTVQENIVRGGKSKCTGTACSSIGIVTAAVTNPGASIRIARNRVYAGDLEAASVTAFATIGLFVGSSSDATVVSNVLHGGATKTPMALARAAILDSTKRVLLHGNTLLASSTVAAANYDIDVSSSVAGNSKDVNVIGNLFVGGAGNSDYGLHTRTCQGVVYTALASNLFVDFAAVELEEGPNACGSPNLAARTSLDVEARVGAAAHGNLVLGPACSDPRCIDPKCVDRDACASVVFATWDKPGAGTANPFDDGPRLSATAPCALVKSDAMLDTAASPDVFGTARDGMFSMGAHEATLCE